MSFQTGFEKVAFDASKALTAIGNSIHPGRAAGTAHRGIRAIGKGISEEVEDFSRHYRTGLKASEKKLPGATLGNARLQTTQKLERQRTGSLPGWSELHRSAVAEVEKAKQDVHNRYHKIKDSRPGFASKHPLATAAAGILTGKALFGEKKPEQPQPQVIYPQ